MIKELLDKYFNIETVNEIIDQVKIPETFAYNKFFASAGEGILGDTAIVPIKRGASVILKSVSREAEHLIYEDNDTYLLSIKLPRFPLKSVIPASDLNIIKSLETQSAVLETLGQRLGTIYKGHKDSFITTLEYMAIGALFGKVIDGEGKTLFEFSSSLAPIEFKDSTTIENLSKIDDALSNELGTNAGYSVVASRKFINKLANKATTENLFKLNQARWLEDGKRRILEVYGTKFTPYVANYKNTEGVVTPFLEDGTAIVTPELGNVYRLYYGRADHTQAISQKPKLFFAATPEELPLGAGYAVVSETKPLPVCLRPNALIRLAFSD
jgi:hypothetical protein